LNQPYNHQEADREPLESDVMTQVNNIWICRTIDTSVDDLLVVLEQEDDQGCAQCDRDPEVVCKHGFVQSNKSALFDESADEAGYRHLE
jgi:hypothetical protein